MEENGNGVFTPFLERETKEHAVSFAVDKLLACDELVRFEIVELVPVDAPKKADTVIEFEVSPVRINELCLKNEWMDKATQKDYANFLHMFSEPVPSEGMEVAAELLVEFSTKLEGYSPIAVANWILPECAVSMR